VAIRNSEITPSNEPLRCSLFLNGSPFFFQWGDVRGRPVGGRGRVTTRGGLTNLMLWSSLYGAGSQTRGSEPDVAHLVSEAGFGGSLLFFFELGLVVLAPGLDWVGPRPFLICRCRAPRVYKGSARGPGYYRDAHTLLSWVNPGPGKPLTCDLDF
jgi:hypothetical protein